MEEKSYDENLSGELVAPISSFSQFSSAKLTLPPEHEWIPSSDVDEISNNHPFIYPSGPTNVPDALEKFPSVEPEICTEKSHGEIRYNLHGESSPGTEDTQPQQSQVQLSQQSHQVNQAYNRCGFNEIDANVSSNGGTPKYGSNGSSMGGSSSLHPPPPHMPGAHPGVSVGYPMLYHLQNMEMKNMNLRRGKWTEEEEAYTNKIIEAFNEGTLVLPGMEGITLRAFLANKLQCDPMRITKKFTGASCLGKRVYHSSSVKHGADAEVKKTTSEIEDLERRFHDKLKETRSSRADTTPDLNYTSPHAISSNAMQQQFAAMPTQVVPPWAYGPSQAAMMQQYLSYTRNFPLNAYVQATQSQQPTSMLVSNKSLSDTTSLDANNSSSGDNSNGNSNSDHSSDKSDKSNEDSSNDDEGATRKNSADSQQQMQQQLHQLQQLQQLQQQQIQQHFQQQYQEQLQQQQQQHANFVNPMLNTQGYNNAYHDVMMRHLMQQQMNLSAEQARQTMTMRQAQYPGDLAASGGFQHMSAEDNYAEQQRIFENTMAQYHYALAAATAANNTKNGVAETSTSILSVNSSSNNDSISNKIEAKSSKKRKNDNDSVAVTLDDETAASSLLGLHSSM